MTRLELIALALPILLLATPAAAQTDKARTLFNVGMAAYNAANYPDAIHAFEDAYQAEPRAGLLFSMAQAHRKQYSIDHQADHLHKAVKLYREYLAKNEGSKRNEAAAALEELDPIEQRMGAADPNAVAPVAPAAPSKPKLMASTDVSGASFVLDDSPPRPFPVALEIAPGPHKVRVVANGYFDYTRDIQAADSGIVPLDVTMREKPALLAVTGEAGAQVTVDGRPSGTTPLQQKIELTPGRHFIAVTKSGFKAMTEDVDVAHGEEKSIDARLKHTGQRVAAWTFLGTGVAGILAGGVLAGVAFQKQNAAEQFLTARTQGSVGASQLAQYEDDKDARDNFRRDAGVAFAAGGVLAATGLVLYAFDTPTVTLPARGEDRGKTPTKNEEQKMEIGFQPQLVPGFYGGALRGSF